MERIEKLLDVMEKENLDGMLLVKDANLRYLSGFTGSESYAVISKKGRAFITDSRYTEQAEQECPGFEVIKWRSPNPDLPETIKSVCDKFVIKRLGFEKNCVSVDLYEKLKNGLGDVELVGTIGLVEKVRSVKDSEEIECIKKAAEITDEAFDEILKYIKPGVTERDIERELAYVIRKKGAEDIGFSIIVASGKNSSKPHAVPSNKPVEEGDFITIDVGSMYNGYRSDMTRTVVLGKASEKQISIYNIVKKSQEESIKIIKAGVECKTVDKLARDIIIEAGIKEVFEYGLGHGVGLEIHEEPSMSAKSTSTLEEGNVVTVEPGIYIPGWGGVRIEDTVAVTKDGCEIITKSPKHLIII
ncbi:MAG: Xaa-Pro peptidase family protein [Tepidanaerobacteraceae bacterium]|jgi:Xaa-Pro aminopeptidase|nr:Xaa-Pro peptidase family protein [Tepidanaerobacteraceae bacterium]